MAKNRARTIVDERKIELGFQYHYIAYDDLKVELKSRLYPNGSPTPKKWTEKDEKAFVEFLEAELDKVFTFQKVKAGEIVRRIKVSEKEVEDVVKQLDSRPPARRNSVVAWGQSGAASGGQENDGPTEEDFGLLEADLSDMFVHLGTFARIECWFANIFLALRMSMIWQSLLSSIILGSRKLSRSTMYVFSCLHAFAIFC